MRKRALLLLACGLIAMLVRPSVAQPVTIELLGDADYFPYSHARDGELAGFYPELIRMLDASLPDVDIVLRPVPWKRGLLMVERGDAAGLLPPYRLENERGYMAPYSAPLGTEQVVIVCREDRLPEGFAGRWPDDYVGMTISNNLGFALQSAPFWAPVREGRIRRMEFPSNEANVIELAVFGRVDCYINDRTAIALSLQRLRERLAREARAHVLAPLRETLALAPLTAHVGYSAVQYAARPELRAFVARFDEALRALQASPDHEAFVTGYWRALGAGQAPREPASER